MKYYKPFKNTLINFLDKNLKKTQSRIPPTQKNPTKFLHGKPAEYISVDIDGILTDYPNCWLQYIEIVTQQKYATRAEAKHNLGELNYQEIKDMYRNSAYKFSLPVNQHIKKFLILKKNEGFKILYCTSRPINNENYPNLKSNTVNWLLKNDLPFDHIVHKDLDLIFLKSFQGNIVFHLEDEFKYAESFKLNKIRVFLVGKHNIANDEFITHVEKHEDVFQICEKTNIPTI